MWNTWTYLYNKLDEGPYFSSTIPFILLYQIQVLIYFNNQILLIRFVLCKLNERLKKSKYVSIGQFNSPISPIHGFGNYRITISNKLTHKMLVTQVYLASILSNIQKIEIFTSYYNQVLHIYKPNKLCCFFNIAATDTTPMITVAADTIVQPTAIVVNCCNWFSTEFDLLPVWEETSAEYSCPWMFEACCPLQQQLLQQLLDPVDDPDVETAPPPLVDPVVPLNYH